MTRRARQVKKKKNNTALNERKRWLTRERLTKGKARPEARWGSTARRRSRSRRERAAHACGANVTALAAAAAGAAKRAGLLATDLQDVPSSPGSPPFCPRQPRPAPLFLVPAASRLIFLPRGAVVGIHMSDRCWLCPCRIHARRPLHARVPLRRPRALAIDSGKTPSKAFALCHHVAHNRSSSLHSQRRGPHSFFGTETLHLSRRCFLSSPLNHSLSKPLHCNHDHRRDNASAASSRARKKSMHCTDHD